MSSTPANRSRALALEGLVIVASILLAFGLDAWWENRREVQEVQVLLTLMDQELADIEAALQQSVERHQAILVSEEAIKIAENWAGAPDAVFAEERFVVRLSALEALREQGDTRLIGDLGLRLLLLGWDTRVQAFADAEENSRAKRDWIRQRIAEIGNLLVDGQDANARVFTDREVINLILLRMTDERVVVEEANALLNHIRLIRAQLNER